MRLENTDKKRQLKDLDDGGRTHGPGILAVQCFFFFGPKLPMAEGTGIC